MDCVSQGGHVLRATSLGEVERHEAVRMGVLGCKALKGAYLMETQNLWPQLSIAGPGTGSSLAEISCWPVK